MAGPDSSLFLQRWPFWILLFPHKEPGLLLTPSGVSWDPIGSVDYAGKTSSLVQLILPSAGLEHPPFIYLALPFVSSELPETLGVIVCSVVPELRRLRQEHHEFQASPGM